MQMKRSADARFVAHGPSWVHGRMLFSMLAALLLLPTALCAQGGSKSDRVLYPLPPPIPLLIGIEGGYGSWDNKGFFSVGDGGFSSCATFGDGKGKGVTFGVKSMLYLNTWFFISPRVRYEPRSGRFLTTVPGDPVRGENDSITMIKEEAQADATFGAAVFDLTIGVEFFRTGIYVFGGGSGGVLLDGFYDYRQRIVSPTNFVYSDTRTTEKLLVKGRSFPTYQKTTMDLRGGLGYIFRIGKVALNPEVFYSKPMTDVFGAPESMKQTGMLGTFSIMYNLGD